MPSWRAHARSDGLLRSRHVSHQNTSRRTISLSSLLRQGRGGWYRGLAYALARFRIEASYGSLRDSFRYSDAMPPPSRVLAELPHLDRLPPHGSKGLTRNGLRLVANY